MLIRFFIGLVILILWILLVNIGNTYDYFNYLDIEHDPLYPFTFFDNLLYYIDFLFLIFNAYINKFYFVMMIYLFIFFTFIFQIYLYLFNKINESKEAIEFNLNIPPLLGVIGTIYAFSSFVSTQQEVNDIIDLLKNNFNNAAMTTILGGITYSFNFLILVINEKINTE